MLLACAVLAIVAAILGSLGACGSETDQEVSVTPLSLFLSLDASNSMAGSMSGNWTTLIDTPPYDCRKRYKVNRRNPIANFSCWPTPSAASMLSHSYDVDASGSRFDKAKEAMPKLLEAFDEAMNNGTDGGKLRTGLLQWANDQAGVVLESPLNHDTRVTKAAVANMILNGGANTCWAPGLCQCYSLLKHDNYTRAEGAAKLCVLISDGELFSAEMKAHNVALRDFNDSTVPIEDGSCGYTDAVGRYNGTNGADNVIGALKRRNNTAIDLTISQDAPLGGYCADLYTDWVAQGHSGKMDHKAVSDFLKASDVSIFGTFVGSYEEKAAQEMFLTSSCENYTWDHPTENCPYYAQVENFEALAEKSNAIAAYQRGLATVQLETTVSICSLDFLYALLAFLPLLAFMLYRLITIVALKDSMRGRLIKMMANKEIDINDSAAHDATVALLPDKQVGDIDYVISYMLFSCCPCMLPMSTDELKMVPQETIHL